MLSITPGHICIHQHILYLPIHHFKTQNVEQDFEGIINKYLYKMWQQLADRINHYMHGAMEGSQVV